jgi:hypothetical protein
MTPQSVSKEDHSLVKAGVLLPVMLEFIQSDVSALNKQGIHLAEFGVKTLQAAEQELITEHLNVRKELRQRGIKIFGEEKTKLGVNANYIIRGYRHHISVLWGLVRTEALLKASQYAGVDLTK